ncbi:MAG TPA: hypothetical protein VFY40_14500 [Blastocatellia bacterium]|nr:hypothetical protein [Blastocatellia bacterium]
MKHMILAIPLLLASFAFISAPAAGGAPENTRREEAVVEFTETVRLQGVLLRGQYLFLHDDAKMAAGEPCLQVYTMKSGKRDRLVIALHCEPVERKQAKRFTVLLTPRNSAYTVREVREIQFAGFAKAHRIPS